MLFGKSNYDIVSVYFAKVDDMLLGVELVLRVIDLYVHFGQEILLLCQGKEVKTIFCHHSILIWPQRFLYILSESILKHSELFISNGLKGADLENFHMPKAVGSYQVVLICA